MLRMFVTLLLFIPTCLVASPAKQRNYEDDYAQCVSSAGVTNKSSVIGCSEDTSRSAKVEMTVLYKKIYARISAQSTDDAAKLEKSQRSWLAYRDAHCELAATYVGSPMYSYCPMQLNIERVNELRELAGK